MKPLPLLICLAAAAVAGCEPKSKLPEEEAAASTFQDWNIPAEYQGEWQGDLARCGEASESRLIIEPRTLRYPEAVGQVLASRASNGGITIVGEFTGEGMKWNRAYVFNLSADGQTLTSVEDGPGLVRQKCPTGG